MEKMAALMLRDPVIIKGKVDRPNVAIKITSYVVSADDESDVKHDEDDQRCQEQFRDPIIRQSG